MFNLAYLKEKLFKGFYWPLFRLAVLMALVGLAVRSESQLNLQGRVFKNGQVVLGDGHQTDPAGLAHQQSGLDVFTKKQLFHGHFIGPVFSYYFYKFGVDFFQTLDKLGFGRSFNAAAGQEFDFLTFFYNQAIAGIGQAGINPQDNRRFFKCRHWNKN